MFHTGARVSFGRQRTSSHVMGRRARVHRGGDAEGLSGDHRSRDAVPRYRRDLVFVELLHRVARDVRRAIRARNNQNPTATPELWVSTEGIYGFRTSRVYARGKTIRRTALLWKTSRIWSWCSWEIYQVAACIVDGVGRASRETVARPHTYLVRGLNHLVLRFEVYPELQPVSVLLAVRHLRVHDSPSLFVFFVCLFQSAVKFHPMRDDGIDEIDEIVIGETGIVIVSAVLGPSSSSVHF